MRLIRAGCLLVQIESFSAVLTLFDYLNPVCEMPAFQHPVSYPQYQICTVCIHPGEEINSTANRSCIPEVKYQDFVVTRSKYRRGR